MTTPPRSWKDLLGRLTQHPAERQRIAEELGVTPYTITRWVTGESEPRVQNIKRLPEVFPVYRQLFAELIQADLLPHTLPQALPARDGLNMDVPGEYLVRALSAYATISGPLRAWSIRLLTLQQAISQLDSDKLGMEITVVQCVAPSMQEQSVRSLCGRIRVGTTPWDTGVKWCLQFLGAESLVGWMVGRGEPGVVQDTEHEQRLFPLRSDLYEKSAVIWPIQREGNLAGCLLVSSTQMNYFTSARLSQIEIYANTLALSFRDEEFYALRRIALHEMPVLSRQQTYASLALLRERVASLRRERASHLSEAEAEMLALQQMEAALLHSL